MSVTLSDLCKILEIWIYDPILLSLHKSDPIPREKDLDPESLDSVSKIVRVHYFNVESNGVRE